jgi:phenylacetate-CoA ligase
MSDRAGSVPWDRRERNPLITDAGFRNLNRIIQHAHAPRWNYLVGDRVRAEDLSAVESFRTWLDKERARPSQEPPEQILDWVRGLREVSAVFKERLPLGFDLKRDWHHVVPMTREDLAARPESIVPAGLDLDRMIVYDTSGTSGHALVAPWHPRAIAINHALVEFALARHGIRPEFTPDRVACFCVSARAVTIVFANVFSVWNQAGFAKVNFHPSHWPDRESARRFFQELAPIFVTGDPVGFAEMLRWEIPARPAALISTAVTLPAGLKQRLEEHYGCPVIDWYSVTETGPLAYACPRGDLHLLSNDYYLEALDGDGFPVAPGRCGELAFTGGRNPFLPLLRYRTGDYGRLEYGPCPCGDSSPRLLNLQGRPPVFFRSADGGVVNQVDIGRVLRELLFIQHEFMQRADGSCRLRIRPAPGGHLEPDRIRSLLRPLFGAETVIEVIIDEELGLEAPSGKVIPYRSELSWESETA